jgi:hypothetical protein
MGRAVLRRTIEPARRQLPHILNCKRPLSDRANLRAIKQEEMLQLALALHRALAEDQPVPVA